MVGHHCANPGEDSLVMYEEDMGVDSADHDDDDCISIY